jgi:cellulose synthase/poly-beta-1,6-N-acetylglucosamine synthase-like glycosyltransferase
MINPSRYSVIVPICHGGEFLAKAVKSLTNVNSPGGGFEVIIAGQKEMMKSIAESDLGGRGWQIIYCGGNRSEILNAACASANGQVWVFADDDCVCPSDWLINVERSLLEYPDAYILGGSDFLTDGASEFDLALDVVLNSWMGTGGTRSDRRMKWGDYYPKLWNMTVIADAAKRVALDGSGGGLIFNPAISVHEDVELAKRIKARGGKVVYAPHVRVEHSRDTTYASFVRRNMAMARICRQMGIHRAPHLTLVAVFVGAPILGVASVILPHLKIIFGFTYVLYILAALMTGVIGAIKKKRAILVMLVPALIVSMHFARAAGYISSLNFRRGEAI